VRKKNEEIEIGGKKFTASLTWIEKSDLKKLHELFNMWKKFAKEIKSYQTRSINLPEGLSESIFAYHFKCAKIEKVTGASSSYDCYDPKAKKGIQIKATSSEIDLTSFGPKTLWDQLYFMDFNNNGKLDGNVKVYKIPKKFIYKSKVNKQKTMKQQQEDGKRPRFSVKEKIIKPKKLYPVKTVKI